VVYDRTLQYVMWNPYMERITGLTAAEMIGTPALAVLAELTERTELLTRALHGETVQSGDMPYTLPRRGASGWYVATYAPRRDASGQPDGVIGILHDITDRKRAEAVLSHQALHDPLTDLANRALFQTRLEEAIVEARRQQSGLVLLVIDLDRFKDVNDNLGHASGDVLLQELARRWRALLHDGDTLARLGGDEFAVVLPTTSGRTAASLVIAQLQRALERRFVLDGHKVEVGASIGVALYPEHGEDTEALLRHADRAMYAAKRSGNAGVGSALEAAA
jgi:diguanylate cyclase (GGDEF)-like protein/PAS domain S-box-containing protein